MALLDFVRDYPGEPVPERKNKEGKTNLDLLEQETVSGSGICWAICKSAPHPRQPCIALQQQIFKFVC